MLSVTTQLVTVPVTFSGVTVVPVTTSGVTTVIDIQVSSGGGGSLGWIDYAANWDTAPTLVSPGVYSYVWLGVTRYRVIPSPYLASGDAFYSDAGLTNLIVARGQ
jgi:hypothetical protein